MQCIQTAYMRKYTKSGMIETQFPKFKWGTISEGNAGHTKSEWGKSEPRIIIAYRINWQD
ncbi:MAG: hypothetical protein QXN55_09320 [Candidatus Nitrosotenuis sp.]|jgi:hypothetical protein|uniref:hypothetical protein n=1 Tax=Candidatus Nitrosotenuis aquarius TaxID=1846278 RepID=UPI000C1E41B4|nr:hypothetical protein [Candidatus Nitrosotenuis aquarius]